MNKQETLKYIDELGIWHELTEHEPIFSMDDPLNQTLPYPDRDAKNLFIRDDKKRNYFLVTVRGPKRVNLKEFQQQHGTRRLSFASAEDLMSMMELVPGSVSPLGLLNNTACNVKFFMDREFFAESGIIGIHPNENTATIWLKAEDLLQMIQQHGNATELVDL